MTCEPGRLPKPVNSFENGRRFARSTSSCVEKPGPRCEFVCDFVRGYVGTARVFPRKPADESTKQATKPDARHSRNILRSESNDAAIPLMFNVKFRGSTDPQQACQPTVISRRYRTGA